MGRVFLFLVACGLVGLVLFGEFPGGSNFLTQDHFGWRESRGLSELSSLLPRSVSLFLYTIDANMVFFGALALFGIFMAGFSVVKAAEFSRSRARTESLHETLGLRKEKTKWVARLLVESLAGFGGRKLGLTWKIAGTLAGVMFFVGLLITGTAYRSVVTAMQDQVKRRAVAIATSLSDGAAMYLKKKNPLELHALLAKYALLDDVAYVYVEDGKGEVLADNPKRISTELQDRLVPGGFRTIRWSTVTLRGQAIYDMRVPISDGQMGAAHVGIWKDSIDKQIRGALFSLVTLVLIILIAGVTIVFMLVNRLSRPIVELTEVARQMSQGDLDTPASVKSRDEIGDLACSLERMRSSLKAAMRRLNRHSSSAE
jgi:HAMP domain-containing protein